MTRYDGGRSALARALFTAKHLTSEWVPTFAVVPRSAFLPDVIWPYDMDTGASVRVSRLDEPDVWHGYVNADVPIVTQWDQQSDEHAPVVEPTSSSSMPSVVVSMLRDLQVTGASRVLEIGTGTGWNAAFLAHRLGRFNVVTVEVDASIAARARGFLRRFGLPVQVITADGLLGHAAGAPYDRIIATCGMRSIPYTWVEQSCAGGLILAPWGTHYSHLDANVRLKVADHGRSASGRFLGPVEFMKLRAHHLTWPEHDEYVSRHGFDDAVTSSTDITEEDLGAGRFDASHFAVGLRVRDCVRSVAEKREGARPVWFYSLTDRSWAVVMFRDGEKEATVRQAGARRLWDEVEAAWRWWDASGRPGYERFGLTVTAEAQTAWLDEPANACRGTA
ncbi:methyltransferase domain-containing protein [Streptomyces sp. NPDC004609]|uniref:methyltransferase domain-containing protein n=1 Tax=Streptomyces sp. NPDC004609 TaxID=3364704 RepID=UPI0036CF7AB9